MSRYSYIEIMCDASDFAIGVVLGQRDNGNYGLLIPDHGPTTSTGDERPLLMTVEFVVLVEPRLSDGIQVGDDGSCGCFFGSRIAAARAALVAELMDLVTGSSVEDDASQPQGRHEVDATRAISSLSKNDNIVNQKPLPSLIFIASRGDPKELLNFYVLKPIIPAKNEISDHNHYHCLEPMARKKHVQRHQITMRENDREGDKSFGIT
ncbi:hypothetical protein E3N88_36627 [Mikania micrantha]|uniref:Reverse transcriptase/retrotransposon-derived protein RNase H-like domain-containing protein n=1 Tax=Mikania micrantha TaxID=192012 RepID=A0A5N6M4F3_9ASTR|nr:hypothetical protein E3N88_36627 [Mikania micrantha]